MKALLKKLAVLVVLIVSLVVWIALPWQGVALIVFLMTLWLAFTRSGQLSWAATRIGVAGLPQRWGASSVIVVGIAGVVGVLVAMFAMGEGFKATVSSAGTDDAVIVLRGGSQTEVNSSMSRAVVPLLAQLPGVERDESNRPLLSAELSQVVSLQSRSDGLDANVQFRGIGEFGALIRPSVRLVQGRMPTPGKREIVVGRGVQAQFKGLDMGNRLQLGQHPWEVVGVFESGDAYESEIWGDVQTLASSYGRDYYQAILVKTGTQGVEAFRAAVEADPQLKFDVLTTKEFYAKQSGRLQGLLTILGTVIGAIMAIGAVFGALNTMYAAVATRAREIATMRALGFQSVPVVTAVMLETMFLALVGGLAGGLIAWVMFNNFSISTIGGNFSQVVFQFKITPELMWMGLKWALGIGWVGGLFPALRAATLPITSALREV